MINRKVQILLATYNGERFLPKQLDSIAKQSYENWEILVRDDGSSDKTVDILKQFREKHPNKIIIINDNCGPTGSDKANFIKLLNASTAQFISLSDQDDIWHKDKILKSMDALQNMHSKYGEDKPAMIYHDYSLIDENNQLLMCNLHNENRYKNKFNRACSMPFGGCISGFSAMFNRALLDKALPFPTITAGHDTILECIARDFGNVVLIPENLASYRRHGNNVSNIEPYYSRAIKKLFNNSASIVKIIDDAKNNLQNKSEITAAYLERYKDELPLERQKLLSDFANIDNLSVIERKSLLLKYAANSFATRIVAALVL